VASEIVHDHVQVPMGIGLVNGVEQLQITLRIARRRSQGEFLSISNPECATRIRTVLG
jgi:hypothetical protein